MTHTRIHRDITLGNLNRFTMPWRLYFQGLLQFQRSVTGSTVPRSHRTFATAFPELRHPSGTFSIVSHVHLADPNLDRKRDVFQTIMPGGESLLPEDHEECSMLPLLHTVYKTMMRLKAFDMTFKQAQRQGRIPFFVESRGEEAAVVASAAALDDDDHIFSQYREHGALLWRGASMEAMAHQCCGTRKDSGKGRQMPMHFGDKEKNFHTISSPLATQLLHATGFGYVQKIMNKQHVVACYFGEGAASEGDFHAALNFASTLKCPVLFICRNNGWSITTPTSQQYAGDGIISRASGYGITSCRVDGADARAVYIATRMARAHILKTSSPVLVECMTHRLGDHSTSDDSRNYVPREILEEGLQTGDPIPRLLSFLSRRGSIDMNTSDEIWAHAIQEARMAIAIAEKEPIEPVMTMFDDVYDTLPYNLQQQKQECAKYLPHMLHAQIK